MAEQAARWRPFHESVVDAIRDAHSSGLEVLGRLLKTTKIPKGHDEIITAFNQRRHQLGWLDLDLGVPADLLEQKRAAQEEAERRREEEIREGAPS